MRVRGHGAGKGSGKGKSKGDYEVQAVIVTPPDTPALAQEVSTEPAADGLQEEEDEEEEEEEEDIEALTFEDAAGEATSDPYM